MVQNSQLREHPVTLSTPLPDDDAPFDALLRRALQAELDQIPVPASDWAALQARLAHLDAPMCPRRALHGSYLRATPLFRLDDYEWGL